MAVTFDLIFPRKPHHQDRHGLHGRQVLAHKYSFPLLMCISNPQAEAPKLEFNRGVAFDWLLPAVGYRVGRPARSAYF